MSSRNALQHPNTNNNASSSNATSSPTGAHATTTTQNTGEVFRNFNAGLGHSNVNTASAANSVILPSTSSRSTAVTALPNTPSTEGALHNFRTLFAPYASTSSPYMGVSSRPPPKRICKRKESKGKARETWTHEVFCLANTDEEATPTRERKITL